MSKKNSSENKILTVPNILTIFRILLIPFIVWTFCTDRHHLTVAILFISAVTDIADGWIARHFHMVSNFGKALDPVADKLTQGITLICLLTKYRLMIAMFVLMAVKELVLGIMEIRIIRKSGVVKGANWHGKINTVMIYLTMITHIVFWDTILPQVSAGMIVCCMVLMTLSFILYAKSLIERSIEYNKKCSGN